MMSVKKNSDGSHGAIACTNTAVQHARATPRLQLATSHEAGSESSSDVD